MRVLLVDDDAHIRGLAAVTLKQAFPNLQVIEVGDAEALDAALVAGGYDLVVTDYQLPWTDGIEVVRSVKAHWPDCPVLMFTASGSEEVAVEAMKAGLDDYVLKSPKHIARLPAAAASALAAAAERAGRSRAEEALRESEAERRRLLERLFAAQDEERRRIARELHDEAGQSVTSLLVGLQSISEARTLKTVKARARHVQEIAEQTLEGLRRLSQGLHPAVLDDIGLAAALARQTDELFRHRKTAVRLDTEALRERLPRAIETALYRIALEALTNAARHAGARVVRVALRRAASWVDLEVEDDGCGFDATASLRASAADGRLGLLGIQERTALLEGCFSLQSERGRGTLLRVSLPLPPA